MMSSAAFGTKTATTRSAQSGHTRALAPVAAAWILSLLFGLGVAASVYRIPIQVSDSLDLIENTDRAASVRAAFLSGVRSSHTMLRPMREAQTKLLLMLGHWNGDRYHWAFRGYHALSVVVLFALFTTVTRPRTWTDVAALACALTVLTGMQTFSGMTREAYPVNHFLLIAIYAMAAVALAQTSGGWAADAAAVLVFTLAVFTLESGLLIWLVAAAGYAAGLRGLSRRAIVAMTLLVVAYFALRSGYLHMASAAIGERTTGFGAGELSVDEQLERFGSNPAPLYLYTATMAAISVLLSQPSHGQWTVIDAWQRGDVAPVYFVEIGTALAMSVLIAWYVLGRSSDGRRRWSQPMPRVFLSVLAGNAAMCFAYAKDEIISCAGVFYAVVAFAAVAAALDRLPRRVTRVRTTAAVVLILAVTGGWAFRSLGLIYGLRNAAYDARREWVDRMPARADAEGSGPVTAPSAMETALRDQALVRRVPNPYMFPAWTVRYWGED